LSPGGKNRSKGGTTTPTLSSPRSSKNSNSSSNSKGGKGGNRVGQGLASPSITLYGRNLGISPSSITVSVRGVSIPSEGIKLLLPHAKMEVVIPDALALELSKDLAGKTASRSGGGGGIKGSSPVLVVINVSVDGKQAEPFSLVL